MSDKGSIRSGLFTTIYDYDRPLLFRQQILISNTASAYVTNAIALTIGLLLPCFFVLIRRSVIAVLLYSRHFISWTYHKIGKSDSGNTVALQSFNRLEDDREGDTFFQKIIDQLQAPGDEDNPIKAVKKVCAEHAVHHIRLEDPRVWPEFLKYLDGVWGGVRKLCGDLALAVAFLLVIAFFLTIFGVGLYVSIVSADLVDGSVVTFGFHNAGDWQVNPDTIGFTYGEGAIVSENRQSRIWAYKKACYNTSDDNPVCNTYYQRQLPFRATSNVSCPFDGDACMFGNLSAYEVTTGLLDSNLLGVNAPASKRFYFSRTTTCAPLVTDERYVFSTGNLSFPNQWEYNYGPSFSYFFPMDTYVTPREWKFAAELNDIPPYRMAPVLYDPLEPNLGGPSTFLPFPEFQAGDNPVTIMFISTDGPHLHLFRRDDPIFPAHAKVEIIINPGTDSVFWYNNVSRAGVLGCVDSNQICADADASLCWNHSNFSRARSHFSDDIIRQRALYLVQIALKYSNIWNVVNYKQADALSASSDIKRIVGINLTTEQWKVEVDGIFAASLSGLQTRIYDFAHGTYASHPYTIDLTPRELQGESNTQAAVLVARMFKFRDASLKNISTFWFWGIVALCIVVFLGSRRFSTAKRRTEVKKQTGDGGLYDWLWLSIVWEYVFYASGKTILCWLYRGAKSGFGALQSSWVSLRKRSRSKTSPLVDLQEEEVGAGSSPAEASTA